MTQAALDEREVVLVIDDDQPLAESLKFALELEGFRVQTFADAESLLAIAEAPARGCLIVDVKLPGLDGLQLIAGLRALNIALPAVLITSNPTPALRARAAAAHTPIVEKPLLGDHLINAVRSLLAG